MTLENEAAPAAAPDIVAPAVVADTPAPTTPVADETIGWEEKADSELKAVWSKNNPDRDETGRFRAKDGTTTEAKVLPDQPQTTAKETQPASIPVPNSWSADVKEKWATLPPEVQTYVSKRESEAHEAITRQGQELKAYEPVKSVIEQHRDIFERNGVTYEDGLGRLLNAERLLEQNAPAAIKQLAQAYGVDLGQFSATQSQPGSAEHALHQRIAQLESQLNDASNRIAQREQSEKHTQQQSMTALIEKFATDKTDWSDLEQDILAEITGIKASIAENLMPAMSPDQLLTKAYERAQRNNPAAWAKKLEAEKKAEDSKRIAEAQKRAEDAKRSNSVNVRSSPADGQTIQSMDDTLKQSYRKSISA